MASTSRKKFQWPRAAMTPKEKFILIYRLTGNTYTAATESGVDHITALKYRQDTLELIANEETIPRETKFKLKELHDKIEALRAGLKSQHQPDHLKFDYAMELLTLLGYIGDHTLDQ